jgi:hypothetical protein
MLISLAVVLASALPCAAIVITFFVDTPTFIERSFDIVIAKCLRPDIGEGTYIDNLHPAEVEVVMILKGGTTLGKLRIATVYNLEAGKTYLLANSGGMAYATNFLAVAERTVVKIPEKFRLDDLKGKKLADQVQAIFKVGTNDAELLSKTFARLSRDWVVMQTPPGRPFSLEMLLQLDKERVTLAARKLKQSKSEKEMREALGEVEEAVKAMKARLATRDGLVAPGPKKP